jgi:hypothetical protein
MILDFSLKENDFLPVSDSKNSNINIYKYFNFNNLKNYFKIKILKIF